MKLYKIKKSAIDKKGRGLYATKDIKAGTKIIDYIGKLITKKQTEETWVLFYYCMRMVNFICAV